MSSERSILADRARHGERVRVAVIGGGANCEHEVSLQSAKAVAAALDCEHDVVALTIERDGVWSQQGHRLGPDPASSLAAALGRLRACQVVLPIVHGPLGEDGALAALAALAGIRCAGAGLTAGAIGMDKWVSKLIAQAAGVATAPGVLVRHDPVTGGWRPPLADVALGAHLVVKPVRAGSSYGVGLVTRPEHLEPAVCRAAGFDEHVLIEAFVPGREIDIAVLRCADGELICSEPLEIVTGATDQAPAIFDTATKYDGSADFRVPAPLSDEQRVSLRDQASRVFAAFGCTGVARVDFFLTEAGWMFNEINTMPGMTEHSQVPRMFAAAGLRYPDLLAELIAASA